MKPLVIETSYFLIKTEANEELVKPEKIKDIINGGEGQRVEFKESFAEERIAASFRDILESLPPATKDQVEEADAIMEGKKTKLFES